MTKIPGLNASATKCGKVYCHRLCRFVAQANDKDGYKLCRINRKTYRVHRLIAKAYLGDSELLVNHKNGIKYDNNLSNLEWVTHSENCRHAIKTGLFKMEKQQKANEKRKKFNEIDINYIREHHAVDENYNTLAKKYKVSRGVIYQIVNKTTYKEVIPND